MTLLDEIAHGDGVSIEFKESSQRDSLKFEVLENGCGLRQRGKGILFGGDGGIGQ